MNEEQLIQAYDSLQKAESHLNTDDYKNAIEASMSAAKILEKHQKWSKCIQAFNVSIQAQLSSLQYEKAKKHLEYLQSILPSKLPKHSPENLQYLNNWGDYWQHTHDYSQALEYYQKALDIQQHLFGKTSIEAARSYQRIGQALGQKGEFEKELIFYRKALGIGLSDLGESHPFTANCYQHIAGVYGVKGDYNTQLMYLQKALHICIPSLGNQHVTTASVLDEIGRTYAMKEDFEAALKHHRKALEIRQELLTQFHPDLANSYFHIAYCLQCIEEFEAALVEYKKAYRIRKKLFGKNDASVAACYNNMGVCFGHSRMYFRQFDYHQKALEILLKIFGIQHPEVAFTYNQLGNCWQRRNSHAQALQQFQFSLVSLVEGFDSPNIYRNPRLKNSVVNLELLNAFSYKAISLFQHYRTHSRAKKDLRRAMVTFQIALELIDQKRHSFQSEHSQLDLIHRFMPVYEGGIQVALELYRLSGTWQYLRYAFTLAEKGKSVLLLSSIKELEAKGIANIPPAMIEEEKHLRQQIVNLEKSIYQEQSIEEQANEMRMSRLQNNLFDFHQQYRDLVENLERQYPDYYQLKYKFEVLDIKDLQEALKREDAQNPSQSKAKILEYFVGEQNIYIFLISAEAIHYHIVEKPDSFEKMVKKMVRTINQLRRQKFIQIARQLYQLLFPIQLQSQLQIHAHSHSQSNIDKLYIIPDASLFYLPFEALLFEEVTNKKAGYGDLPYLIQRFAISYHYSTSLLYNGLQKKQVQQIPHSYVGFAPIYKSESTKTSENRGGDATLTPTPNEIAHSSQPTNPISSPPTPSPNGTFSSIPSKPTPKPLRSIQIEGRTYYELIHTQTEVEAVQRLFEQKGFVASGFFHKEASVSNFLKQIDRAKFIHIAAHGIFNKERPEFSGIVFSLPEKKNSQHQHQEEMEGKGKQNPIFYTADAYHLQLQADLVVLSSCESGIGKLSKSEGMMAMNRALLYAGAKNVIFTLFKVYDASASDLTYLIFEGIVNLQLSYSEALQRAKLQLIQNEKMTPKSWAGFVLLGG